MMLDITQKPSLYAALCRILDGLVVGGEHFMYVYHLPDLVRFEDSKLREVTDKRRGSTHLLTDLIAVALLTPIAKVYVYERMNFRDDWSRGDVVIYVDILSLQHPVTHHGCHSIFNVNDLSNIPGLIRDHIAGKVPNLALKERHLT